MRTVSLYHRHRFPAEIISHCVWLYFRFPLSLCGVEEMLAMRGVKLSYETIREWTLKFGQAYTNAACVADLLAPATDGISTRYSSRSTDAFITFGVQWIRMGMYWIFWFRLLEISACS